VTHKPASGEPEKLYVQKLDAGSNRVVVGPVTEAERQTFHLLRPHWVDGAPLDREVVVRIRHRHQGAIGKVKLELNGHFKVMLDAPARAVTPGQAAVVYDGARVLGGGWII
jgi:tRNA-specific 2-thiouridylase